MCHLCQHASENGVLIDKAAEEGDKVTVGSRLFTLGVNGYPFHRKKESELKRQYREQVNQLATGTVNVIQLFPMDLTIFQYKMFQSHGNSSMKDMNLACSDATLWLNAVRNLVEIVTINQGPLSGEESGFMEYVHFQSLNNAINRWILYHMVQETLMKSWAQCL